MNKKTMLMITLLTLLLGLVPAVAAQAGNGVTVGLSQETAVVIAGDWVEFTSTIHNDGATATAPLVAHLSVAPIDTLRHVDPEDWLPQATQRLPALASGDSTQLNWRVHTLFEGNYAAYVTVLAEDGSMAPVADTSLRLQVAPDNILPLQDVIPMAVIIPFFPLALLSFSVTKLRRSR